MMNNKDFSSDWVKVISFIEEIKPFYGNINIEFIFHQGSIKKVKMIQKENVLVLENNNIPKN